MKRKREGAIYWLHERSHYALEVCTAVFYITFQKETTRSKHCLSWISLLPPVAISLGLFYAVGMHLFLMDRYWFNKSIASSVGLVTETVLYISAACTYPLVFMYLRKHHFSPHLTRGSAALPCMPKSDDFDKTWLRGVEEEAARLEQGRPTDEESPLALNGETNTWSDSVYSPRQTPLRVGDGEREALLANRRHSTYRTHDDSSARVGMIRVNSSSPRDSDGSEEDDTTEAYSELNRHSDNCSEGIPVSISLNYSMLWSLAAVFVGYVLASGMVALDLGDQRIYDESKIRTFLSNDTVPQPVVVLYWLYVVFVFYGIFAAITACVIIHSLSLVQRRAITAVFTLLPWKKDLSESRKLVDETLNFLTMTSDAVAPWFVVHQTVSLLLLLMMVCYEFLEADWNHPGTTGAKEQALLWASQFFSIGVLAFKFISPMYSASRVTSCWKNALYNYNRSNAALEGGLVEQQALLSYMRRCRGGFVVYGLLVTDRLLLIVGTVLVALLQVIMALESYGHSPNP